MGRRDVRTQNLRGRLTGEAASFLFGRRLATDQGDGAAGRHLLNFDLNQSRAAGDFL